MTGIYDCFGYGPGYDVPFEERYRLIKSAGFDCVMLWWSDKFGRGQGFKEDALLAARAGLGIENIHAPVHEQNCLSQTDSEGESVFGDYMQCIKDCNEFDIPVTVIHLPDDEYPLNDTGLERLEILINEAEKYSIGIAFENLSNTGNLKLVLDRFRSKNAGFCYDTCHHANYAPDCDLPGIYGDRLMALHLQDNGGKHNQHQLPFDGNIDWTKVMQKISLTGYKGAVTLEPMNWDYEDLSISEFLKLAHERAVRLDNMRADGNAH